MTRTLKALYLVYSKAGGIPPDLRSGTSYLRPTTSNNRYCTSLKSSTFLLGSTTVLGSIHCSVVRHGHFVICICPCLAWIDVASVKHYLNATKAKQSALDARTPMVGGREPHLCSQSFGLELRPFEPRAYRDPPTLAE